MQVPQLQGHIYLGNYSGVKNNMEKDKLICGTIIIVCIAGLQMFAWYTGHDGIVFATTSAIIGGIVGALFGFTIQKIKD